MSLSGSRGGLTDLLELATQINNPTNGQTLAYQDGFWINTSAAGGSVAASAVSYDTTSRIILTSANVQGALNQTDAALVSLNLTDDLYFFGSGLDGPRTQSAGIFAMTRDMYWTNLTINGTGQINTAGFKIFVNGTLDITSAPANAIFKDVNVLAGTGGATGLAGTAGSNTVGSLPLGASGGAGAAATTGAGAAGTGGGASVGAGGRGSGNGAGGLGSGGAGGAGSATQSTFTLNSVYSYERNFLRSSTALQAGGGGRGGASGGGDATNTGGGGGGGGAGGNMIYIAARTITRGASTAAGAIKSIAGVGAAGGTPATGNCGGGGGAGGGGGGWVYIAYRFLTGATATNAIDVTGGSGGNGGNGVGTGVGGNGGRGSEGGIVTMVNLTTGVVTETTSIAQAAAGGTASGNTGGTGSTATTAQISL